MRRWPGLCLGLWIVLFGLACTPTAEPTPQGPRLLSEETLAPATPTPLLLVSASPTIPPIQIGEAVISPTASQVRNTFRLRTATPPDSPTPSITASPTRTLAASPSPTMTPSRTLTPTVTVTFTPRPPASATPELIVLNVTVTATPPQAASTCTIAWFFEPAPPTCPLTPPTTSLAAYQAMQNGLLIWVQNGAVIFALFNDGNLPAWVVTADRYQEGEVLPVLSAPPGLWQPQRGFGKFWLEDSNAQSRLGWATSTENPYSAFIQSDASTGTRYLSGPTGQLFALYQDQSRWEQIR